MSPDPETTRSQPLTVDGAPFPGWDELYQQRDPRTMPWFYADLDPDIASALTSRGLNSGRCLDIGAGPGTQAIALARLGFDVTATDLSPTAVQQASAWALRDNVRINWVVDDILHSVLSGPFDLVLDRGCFHVLPPERRDQYARVIRRLLTPGGLFILKCFSCRETREGGPFRFAPGEIHAIFSPHLNVVDQYESRYQGTLANWPIALVALMTR